MTQATSKIAQILFSETQASPHRASYPPGEGG